MYRRNGSFRFCARVSVAGCGWLFEQAGKCPTLGQKLVPHVVITSILTAVYTCIRYKDGIEGRDKCALFRHNGDRAAGAEPQNVGVALVLKSCPPLLIVILIVSLGCRLRSWNGTSKNYKYVGEMVRSKIPRGLCYITARGRKFSLLASTHDGAKRDGAKRRRWQNFS